MSSPRQAGHRVRDAIAVFEQNKGKIVFSEDRNRKLYPKDRPLRPLLRDNIYIQGDLKYRRSTGNESPSPPLVKGAVVKRITYSSPPRYQLDCKEDSSPSSPTSRQSGAWRDRDVTTVNDVPLSSVSPSASNVLQASPSKNIGFPPISKTPNTPNVARAVSSMSMPTDTPRTAPTTTPKTVITNASRTTPDVSTPTNGSRTTPDVSTPTNGSRTTPDVFTSTNGSRTTPNVSTPTNGSRTTPNVFTPTNGLRKTPNLSTPTNGLRTTPNVFTPTNTSRTTPNVSTPPNRSRTTPPTPPNTSRTTPNMSTHTSVVKTKPSVSSPTYTVKNNSQLFKNGPSFLDTSSESVLDLLEEAQCLVRQLMSNDEGERWQSTQHCNLCEMRIREVERDNRILREENKTLKQELTLAHQKEEEGQRQLSSVFSAYTALQQHMKAVREKANKTKGTSSLQNETLEFGMRPKTASPSLVRIPSHESSV